MGYPMTWRRIISRNRLDELDYDKAPLGFNTQIGPGSPVPEIPLYDGHHYQEVLLYEAVQEIIRLRNRLSAIGGDFKRLRSDLVDENIVCQGISAHTGIDAETVAVVLQAFVAQ